MGSQALGLSIHQLLRMQDAQNFNVEIAIFPSLRSPLPSLYSVPILRLSLPPHRRKESKLWSFQIPEDHGRLTNFAQTFYESCTCAAVRVA